MTVGELKEILANVEDNIDVLVCTEGLDTKDVNCELNYRTFNGKQETVLMIY